MTVNPYDQFRKHLDRLMSMRREHDQEKLLLKLQEDALPLLTETIPEFNRFCGFLLNFLPDARHVDVISAISILQTILNSFPNKYYYILRVVQVIGAGLLNQGREVKAAFLKQLAEVLAAAETNPEILRAVRSCRISLVQGIIMQPTCDAQSQDALINLGNYQGVFLQILGRTDAFLRVVDDLIGVQDTFASLCQLVRADNAVAQRALEKLSYYVGKVDDYDALALSIVELLRRDFSAENDNFYTCNLPFLILQAFENFSIQRASVPLLVSYLRLARLRRETGQFTEKFDNVLNMLEETICAELFDQDEAKTVDCLLFAEYLDDILACGIVSAVILPYLLNFVYEQMYQAIKARNTFLKSSAEYKAKNEDVLKFQQTIEKLMTSEETRKKYHAPFQQLIQEQLVYQFRDQEAEAQLEGIQINDEELRIANEQDEHVVDEIEHQYMLVSMVLKYFGIQFFPAKFYLVCCRAPSEPGQITGAMIILMALQYALVHSQNIQHFKKYFIDNTFLDIIMQPQTQQNNLQRILLLRIVHLLLERSFEIVATDWFAKQQKYQAFVQHLFQIANSQEPHYIDGYGTVVIDFIKSTELVSFQNKSVESFEFYVEDQALLLLSYLSNFIGEPVFQAFVEADLDEFLNILLTNCASFSQAVSFGSAIIIGQLCASTGVVERVKRLLFDCSDIYEQINLIIIQNLASFIPAISIVHRMRSGEYKKLSQVSAAPLAPLVNYESCQLGSTTVEALRRCLLLNNFEQKEGLVKLKNLNERFQKLNFLTDGRAEETQQTSKNKLQVDNIMMHPISQELCDILILSPLQYLVNSTTYLKVICNQIIFEIIKLEPELLINSIINFVTSAQRSMDLQDVLAMPTINMSMSDNSLIYIKQQEAARLLKVVLGTNGFIIPELSICVIEHVQQAIQRYTALSAIDGRGQTLIMGFMDLLYNSSLGCLDAKHENIIKLLTNFKYEQIQDIQQYISFVAQRIQIIQALADGKQSQSGADEEVYQFWLHAFNLLLKYSMKYPRENDPSAADFGGRIHQFFSVFFKFNSLNLEHIVEILMAFLEQKHYNNKNISVIFAMFLQNFNTLVKQKIKYREFAKGNYSKMTIFDGRMSVRLCATFLTIAMLIQLQYGHQFQDICYILEEEIRERPEQLYGLFQLLQNDRPREHSTKFQIPVGTAKPHFTEQQYTALFGNIAQILLFKLKFFQPRFIQLVYQYNSSHALPQDPEELFREAMDQGYLLMLMFLLNWKINQLDIGQRDAIVELIGKQLSKLDDSDNEAELRKKTLIFRFLHELQLESQQINFSIVNKFCIQIQMLLVSLFKGLCNQRIKTRLDAQKSLETMQFDQTRGALQETLPDDKQKFLRIPEDQHQLVKALDVELAGEIVENYKTFLSCDLNVQEYEYDMGIYNTFKSYPYSFSRCLFEMGRHDIVQQLYRDLFAIFHEFSLGKQQLPNYESWLDKDDQTSLALLDQIISIGRIPVDFTLDAGEVDFLITSIVKNCRILATQEQFKPELAKSARGKQKQDCGIGISTAPLMRRLLWICAEIDLVPCAQLKQYAYNFCSLIAHSDQAFRFYQMQVMIFQELILPISFRVQFLKRAFPREIGAYIAEFRSIVFLEFKMAVESAYYCARTSASESRQTRIMAIPYLALQIQWPREFAIETMKIATQTWLIDPVAKKEAWFTKWQAIDDEIWECATRYINARNYLMLFKIE